MKQIERVFERPKGHFVVRLPNNAIRQWNFRSCVDMTVETSVNGDGSVTIRPTSTIASKKRGVNDGE